MERFHRRKKKFSFSDNSREEREGRISGSGNDVDGRRPVASAGVTKASIGHPCCHLGPDLLGRQQQRRLRPPRAAASALRVVNGRQLRVGAPLLVGRAAAGLVALLPEEQGRLPPPFPAALFGPGVVLEHWLLQLAAERVQRALHSQGARSTQAKRTHAKRELELYLEVVVCRRHDRKNRIFPRGLIRIREKREEDA